jgi:hypothetical protein
MSERKKLVSPWREFTHQRNRSLIQPGNFEAKLAEIEAFKCQAPKSPRRRLTSLHEARKKSKEKRLLESSRVLREGREALRIKRQATTVTFNLNIEGKLREMFGAGSEEDPFVTARNSFSLMTKRRLEKACTLGKENV